MIRNTNGAHVDVQPLLPHVKTSRFSKGYGEVWTPGKPIEDITQWTKSNIDEICEAAKKAGCLKMKAKLQTGENPAAPGEIAWENLDWFDGAHDLTQIPHWDWAVNDQINVIALGQRDGEVPRKNPTCNAPTEIVGKAISNAAKSARCNGEKFPETVSSMVNFLPCIRSPEQKIILLSTCFEVARRESDQRAKSAIMSLVQKACDEIQGDTVIHNWQDEPGTVLFVYTGPDHGNDFSPVVHWAMPYDSELPENNLWRARLYLK